MGPFETGGTCKETERHKHRHRYRHGDTGVRENTHSKYTALVYDLLAFPRYQQVWLALGRPGVHVGCTGGSVGLQRKILGGSA